MLDLVVAGFEWIGNCLIGAFSVMPKSHSCSSSQATASALIMFIVYLSKLGQNGDLCLKLGWKGVRIEI